MKMLTYWPNPKDHSIGRGFFLVQDDLEAQMRYETGKAEEPEREYQITNFHHFETGLPASPEELANLRERFNQLT